MNRLYLTEFVIASAEMSALWLQSADMTLLLLSLHGVLGAQYGVTGPVPCLQLRGEQKTHVAGVQH